MQLLESGSGADTIYLNFVKAFDKVDHRILLRKLRMPGVGGSVLRWIYCFPFERRQAVAVESAVSGESVVKSGVP